MSATCCPFGLGVREDPFEQVLACPHDQFRVSLGSRRNRILRRHLDLVGGRYHVEQRRSRCGLDAPVGLDPDGCECAADDLAVAVDDVKGEEPQDGGLVDIGVEEDRALGNLGRGALDHVADERVK